MDNFKKENDNIIIHLPIKSEAIKNNNKEKELLKYNPDLTEPAGYEENITLVVGLKIINLLMQKMLITN